MGRDSDAAGCAVVLAETIAEGGALKMDFWSSVDTPGAGAVAVALYVPRSFAIISELPFPYTIF